MATKCVDISADKNLTHASPFAMWAFIACYIVTNILMKPDFLFLIVIFIEMLLCQIFFQYSPRLVFMTLQYLGKQEYLTPNFDDIKYYPYEKHIPELDKVINWEAEGLKKLRGNNAER